MNRNEVIEVINDKLKDLKYYTKEMEEVLKSANYFINELEKQVKKEPKFKAGDLIFVECINEYGEIFDCFEDVLEENNGKLKFKSHGLLELYTINDDKLIKLGEKN